MRKNEALPIELGNTPPPPVKDVAPEKVCLTRIIELANTSTHPSKRGSTRKVLKNTIMTVARYCLTFSMRYFLQFYLDHISI